MHVPPVLFLLIGVSVALQPNFFKPMWRYNQYDYSDFGDHRDYNEHAYVDQQHQSEPLVMPIQCEPCGNVISRRRRAGEMANCYDRYLNCLTCCQPNRGAVVHYETPYNIERRTLALFCHQHRLTVMPCLGDAMNIGSPNVSAAVLRACARRLRTQRRRRDGSVTQHAMLTVDYAARIIRHLCPNASYFAASEGCFAEKLELCVYKAAGDACHTGCHYPPGNHKKQTTTSTTTATKITTRPSTTITTTPKTTTKIKKQQPPPIFKNWPQQLKTTEKTPPQPKTTTTTATSNHGTIPSPLGLFQFSLASMCLSLYSRIG